MRLKHAEPIEKVTALTGDEISKLGSNNLLFFRLMWRAENLRQVV